MQTELIDLNSSPKYVYKINLQNDLFSLPRYDKTFKIICSEIHTDTTLT